MVAEGIDNAAETPAMGFGKWIDDASTGGAGLGEDGVGVVDREDEAQGAAVERLRAEVEMFGGLVADPEF